MWKFVGDKKGLEPLPGLPLEAGDAEWKDALAAFEANAGDGAGKAVEASGLYQKVKDEPQPVTKVED